MTRAFQIVSIATPPVPGSFESDLGLPGHGSSSKLRSMRSMRVLSAARSAMGTDREVKSAQVLLDRGKTHIDRVLPVFELGDVGLNTA